MENINYYSVMSFSKKLGELRKEKDLSQDELAKALGATQRQLSSWETGKMKPSFDALVKVSRFFGVSIDYLVFDNVPREGVEAINDFELYQKFRETEKLEASERKLINDLIDMALFRVRVKNMVQEEKQPVDLTQPALRKVAGKR